MLLRLLIIPFGVGLLGLSLYNYAAASGLPPAPAPSLAAAAASAKELLGSKPLSADAFYSLGVAAERAGRQDHAHGLISRASQLDPRRATFMLWLFANASSAGRISDALVQAERIARLNPEASAAVSGFLGLLAKDPAARRDIATRFANTPMILEVVTSAAQQGLGAAALGELLQGTDVAALPDGVVQAQSALTAPLLKEGRAAEAREVWLRVAGIRGDSAVYDGSFAGSPASAPFGWTLQNTADLQTEIVEGSPSSVGALKVTSFGSLTATAAEQTLAISPGRYRLSFRARTLGQTGGESAFSWTLRCGAAAPFLEAVLNARAGEWLAQQVEFTLPSECPMQILRLGKLGTPDQQSRTLLVSHVAVDPIN